MIGPLRTTFFLSGLMSMLGVAGLTAGDIRLKTQLAYKEHADFVRVTEFLNGRENLGSRAVVRTQPQSRTGLYFSLAVRVGELPVGSKVRVDVIRVASPEPQEHQLDLPERPGKARELVVGLTGGDWSASDERPVAWRVQLLDAAGGLIASEKSFLWGK